MSNNPRNLLSPRIKFSGSRCHPCFGILPIMVAVVMSELPTVHAQDLPPVYKNSGLSVDARVADLIGRMTVEETSAAARYVFRLRIFTDTVEYVRGTRTPSLTLF